MPELTPEAERELTALDEALAGRPVPPDLADLGELAVALRADRPEPSLAFGHELDERVQRGFRGPDPRKPASRSFWARLRAPGIGAAVAAGLAAIVITAPTPPSTRPQDQSGSSSSGGAASSEEVAPLSRDGQEPAPPCLRRAARAPLARTLAPTAASSARPRSPWPRRRARSTR